MGSSLDLNVFKQAWSNIEDRTFFGDKIYKNDDFFEQMKETKNSIMLTPIKGIKNQSDFEKKFNRACNDLYSKAVSTVRQPIESLFNWLIEKNRFSKS